MGLVERMDSALEAFGVSTCSPADVKMRPNALNNATVEQAVLGSLWLMDPLVMNRDLSAGLRRVVTLRMPSDSNDMLSSASFLNRI